MKQFFDFFPIAAFVAVYYFTKDMILATKLLIGASALQIAGYWLWKRQVEKMHLWTFVILLVMGGLTISLNDKTFIMWRPTLINWLFAVVFLGSQFVGKRNLVRILVEGFLKQTPHLKLDLPESRWLPLNLIWVVFFILLGSLNIFVLQHFDDDTWVTYKTLGQTLINMTFLITQVLYLSRHITEVTPDNPSDSQG